MSAFQTAHCDWVCVIVPKSIFALDYHSLDTAIVNKEIASSFDRQQKEIQPKLEQCLTIVYFQIQL